MKTEQVVERFLTSRSAYCSKRTVEWYHYMLDQMTDWMVERDASTITTDDLYQFLAFTRRRERADMRAGVLKNISIAGMVRAIRAWARWSHANGLLDKDISAGIIAPPTTSIPKSLTLDQVERIERHLEQSHDQMAQRDQAVVMFMLSTGCRASEVTTLTIERMNLDEGTCYVIGKGNKERKVAMSPRTRNLVQQYLGQRASGAAFLKRDNAPLTNVALRELLDHLGEHVEFHIHPHALRHTFGSLFAANGGDASYLQTLMGHTQIETTHIYIQSARVEAAIQAHHKYAPV